MRKALRIAPGTYLAVNIGSLLSVSQLLLFQWVGRPTAVQTESSSVASALEHGQIPVSCLGPFPDRAECWLRAQSPATLSSKRGLSGNMGIHCPQGISDAWIAPAGWCPDLGAGG